MKDKQIIAAILFPTALAMLLIFPVAAGVCFYMYGLYMFTRGMAGAVLGEEDLRRAREEVMEECIEKQQSYIKLLEEASQRQFELLDALADQAKEISRAAQEV